MTNSRSYADLEIRIQAQRDEGYPVDLTLNSEQQFGPGRLDPKARPELTGVPAEDGQALFNWLLADDALKTAWAEIRGQHPQRRVRLRLDADAPELHALPWELLRESTEDTPALDLAAAESTPFSRYLAMASQPGSPILQRPLKILVAIADPTNLLERYKLAPLDVDKEWASLQKAAEGVNVKLTLLPQPCTLAALQAELKQGYHVLHYIGHGAFSEQQEKAVLFLADEDNQAALVSDKELAEVLAGQLVGADTHSEDKLRLIFLAGCQTATRSPADAFRGLAPGLVAAGVPAVLAMQDLVPIDTAREFSRVFYQCLLSHGVVDLASNEARAALLAAKKSGAAIPVLFMRLPDGQLLAPPIQEFEPEEFEPKTVYIPAGQFWMGSDADEDGSRPYERPRHQVYLDHFRIGQYPVTNREYAYFVRDENYRAPRTNWQGQRPAAETKDHPVMGVSWYDAFEYCRWLSNKTKRHYRLPTEAEWEKGARGESNTAPYPWGEWQDDQCNFEGTESAAVDAFPAQSHFGNQELFDLVGNAPEWTLSLCGQSFSPDPEYHYPWDKNPDRNDLQASNQVFRIYRGGSYTDSNTKRLRCAARRGAAPDSKSEFEMEFGFRVVLEVEETNNE